MVTRIGRILATRPITGLGLMERRERQWSGLVRMRERAEATLTWQEAVTAVDAVADGIEVARTSVTAVAPLGEAELVVYTGAGSSLHLAEVVAWVHREMLGNVAVAVPLSELLLRGNSLAFRNGPATPIVLFSRSGATSEALAVAQEYAAAGHEILAITCRPRSALAKLANHTVAVSRADERAIVMTRSFAGMLAAGLRLISSLAPDSSLAVSLDQLPSVWTSTASSVERAWLLAQQRWSRVVVLGGGAAFGIAREATLKITETSGVPANAWQPLEFRHGPIAVCEPNVLVIALLLDEAAETESGVVFDCAQYGATVWVITGSPSSSQGELVDVVGPSVHPIARLPLILPAVHAFSIGHSLVAGADPDTPRHLSQVVVLDQASGELP